MSKPNPTRAILTLESKLTFSRYKNFTIAEVIEQSPKFIAWAIEEQKIELDNNAYNYLQSQLKLHSNE